MSKELWKSVDHYLIDHLIPADAALDEVLKANTAAGLPAIDVAPNQGKFLHLLARMQGAKRILEIGTLGGYSTIWLARALPAGGKLVTLELESKHAEQALKNLELAGVKSLVKLRLGPALDSLAALEREGAVPFDFIFIDADKENIPNYFRWALRLARIGSVIVCDNVVREGAVIEPNHADPRVQGVRQFFDLLTKEKTVETTALQTVGMKGYDGFTMSVVIKKL